jgi:hypothetical protein
MNIGRYWKRIWVWPPTSSARRLSIHLRRGRTEAVEVRWAKPGWCVKPGEGIINQDRIDDGGVSHQEMAQRSCDKSDKVFDESGKYHGEATREPLLWLEKEIGGAVPRDLSNEELEEKVEAAYIETKIVRPLSAKSAARRQTGELFDQLSCRHYLMMKLIHLWMTKFMPDQRTLLSDHAAALGGKAQLAASASEMKCGRSRLRCQPHLQELLTVKSDDVQGEPRLRRRW